MAKKEKETKDYHDPTPQPALEWLKEKLGVKDHKVKRSQNKDETDQLKEQEGKKKDTPFKHAEDDEGIKRNELRTIRKEQDALMDDDEKNRRKKYYGD